MSARLDPYFLLAILVVITIHEFSHALAADYLGDPTPRLRNRLTLNPIAHLDPLGALAFVIFGFGWAKPVPIDPFNLRNPKRDSMIISLAGPVSNLLTAGILALIIRLLISSHIAMFNTVFLPFFLQVILVSIILAIFNLIPIHPLDGGKILVGLLPQHQAYEVDNFLNRYGLIILVLLLFTGSFSQIISPLINLLLSVLLPTSALLT